MQPLAVIQNAFRIEDLRRKILITLALLAVYRVGSYIPVPGVDTAGLQALFGAGSLFGLLDLFSGGALTRFSIFALGVNPYITASIILQMLTVVIPKLEEMAKEGVEGRKKIQQYTRYGTVLLGVIQAYGTVLYARNYIANYTFFTVLNMIVALTAGTMFLMWLGEKISEKGIGNGVSLIIFASIVSRIPQMGASLAAGVGQGGVSAFSIAAFLLLAVVIIGGVVLMQEGQRRIPVQYAKRMVGRRMYGGQSTHIPLRVNSAGVIPVIFAASVLAFPTTLAMFAPSLTWLEHILDGRSFFYNLIYVLLVVFFTYFYTAITFNPQKVSDDMKKYGGFIPGIRPGRPTSEFLEKVLVRITLVGAIFLGIIAILPALTTAVFRLPQIYFGGTSLLIMVGVALDTMKQVEAQLLMRNYEGFIK
ncbi:MAG: preprotein translocase subunit SecY [Firmicutes bacterium]|nr:preprotein translocase subunit SecY [Bacillota bacterium]